MENNRILVVEDDDNLREAICTFLEFNEYDPISAANGNDALFILQNEPIDLVVCDINLPDILGTDILKSIRNDDTLYRMPFIFLSAFADKKDISIGMNLGADDYITKPFAQKTLIEVIQARLRKAKLENKYLIKEINGRVLATISNNLSHEIITPLNGIMNGAYFINSVPESTKVADMKDAFSSIYAASLRMKRDIQNMILASTLETQGTFAIDQFDLSNNISIDEKIKAILSQYTNVNGQQNIEANIAPVKVKGSQKYLRIIFTELIDNSLKFGIAGPPIRLDLSGNENGFIFSISNTCEEGISFTSREIGLYKKFHTDYSRNGLGLGLFVTKNLCEQLGIDFEIHQKGNSITVRLEFSTSQTDQ